MKILHISKYYTPYKGGIENVVHNLVEGSKQEGHHVDVLCFNDSNKNSKEVLYNHKIIRTRRLFTLFSLPISLSYLIKIFQIKNNYDIIHVHLPNPLSVLGIFLNKINAKIVIHWHSDIIEQQKLYFFLKTMHRKVLQKSDKIILTTKNYLRSSTQLFNFHNKCEVIPIGIKDISKSEQQTKNNKINSKEIVIFSVGRLVNYKGFELLIQSAQYLNKNIKIIIGGTGPLKKNLEKLIIDTNVSETVSLVGSLSRNELINCFKNADIFCLPSITRNEAYGVVLLEAMCFSLPVVCFNIKGSGVPWVAKNKYNSIVVNKIDSESLSKALNKISSNKEMLETYSLNSRKRYEANFTVEKMQQMINKIYYQINE